MDSLSYRELKVNIHSEKITIEVDYVGHDLFKEV